MLKSKKPAIAETVAQWLDAVERAGAEMAARGDILEKTEKDLNILLISFPDCVAYIKMGEFAEFKTGRPPTGPVCPEESGLFLCPKGMTRHEKRVLDGRTIP